MAAINMRGSDLSSDIALKLELGSALDGVAETFRETKRIYIMNICIKTALLAAVCLTSPLAAKTTQPIVRHTNPPPAIILGGVTIPPGAEIVMLSGQLASPIDPAKTDSVEAYGDTKIQTVSTFKKIKTGLEKLGYSMSDVVKLTVFVTGDPKLGGKMDFAGFNAGYREFFGTAENPNLVARSTVQVAGLAGPNFLIEIEAIAAKVPKNK